MAASLGGPRLSIDFVEERVRKQRREGSALRRSLVPIHHDPRCHDAGIEVATDEPEHATVRDALREPAHQHVVVHPIEEGFEVHVHHPAAAFLDVTLRRARSFQVGNRSCAGRSSDRVAAAVLEPRTAG